MAGNALAGASNLQPVDTVLVRVAKRPVVAKAASSEAVKLLRDLADFHRTSGQLSADQAAMG